MDSAFWIPRSPAAGTFLVKLSAADYDVGWVGVPAPIAGRGIVIVGTTVNFAQAGAYTTGAVPFATGVATIGFDAANFSWSNVTKILTLSADPVNPADAATKNYVDNLVSGVALVAGRGIVVAAGAINFAQNADYTAGAIPFATGLTTMGFDAANLFWDQVNAFLGVGTNLPADRLNVYHLLSDAGNHIVSEHTMATDTVGGTKRALNGTAFTTGAASPWNAGLISGGSYSALHQGSGATTSFLRFTGIEVYAGKGNLGTGAMAGSVCVYIQSQNANAVGVVTDAYDIYIASPIVTGTISNNYGVYQVSTSAFNFFGGNTAIGTATFSTTIITRMERAYVTNTQAVYGTFCDVTNTPAAGDAQINCAGRFTFRTAGGQQFTLLDFSTIGCWGEVIHNGTNTVNTANGVRAFVNKANTGTITAAMAVRGAIDNNNGAGTITTGYVFFAQSPVVTGTFGTWYGYYCQASGVSNGYGFYQVGTGDFNFFAGNLSMSTATFDANIAIRIQKSYAVSGASTIDGFYADLTETAGAAASGIYRAGNFAVTLAGAQNYTNALALTNIRSVPVHNGTGTATAVLGIYLSPRKSNTGAITSCYGAYVQAQNNNAAGAIVTLYDFYVGTATTTGGITTHYGLYLSALGGTTTYGIAQVGTTELNYLAGFSAFGSSAPVNTTFALFGASTAAISSQRILRGSAAYAGTVEGDYWNDFTQQCLIGYIDGLKQYDVRDGFVQTADQDVTNTNVETTMFGAGIGTLTFPANFFVIGKTVRIKLVGVLSQPVAGPTWTWRVKLGGVTLATTGAVTHAAETNRVWLLEFLLTCRTTGAGGTVIGQGGVFHYETGGPASVNLSELPMTAAAALNTTLARTLDVTLQLSAADAAQHSVTTNATVEVIA